MFGLRPARMTGAVLLALVVTGSIVWPVASQEAAPDPAAPALPADPRAEQPADPEADASGASVTRQLSSPRVVFLTPRQWRRAIPDPLAARVESLEKRASRRAYLGAPPVMPHSRNYAKNKTCLECHAEGMRIGTKYAPKMSHPELTSCQQCHVEGKNLDFPQATTITPAFTGPREPQGGARAWPGAPPLIPHSLLMRTDCLSCHAPDSYPGMQTSHPERLNCVQCHGVAASLDQTSPFFSGKASGVIPIELPSDRDAP